MINYEDKPIIFFDGVCNLCNSSVQFIIKHDKKEQFLFTSLQSDASKQILLHYNLENLDFKTILLLDKGVIYNKSTAVLKICKKLNSFYPLLYAFILIPKFLRDSIYNFISKNRYKWFGIKKYCMTPNDSIKKRFLV